MTVRYSNIGQRLPIFTQNLAAALKGSMKTAPGIPDVNVDSPGNAANVIGELQRQRNRIRPRGGAPRRENGPALGTAESGQAVP